MDDPPEEVPDSPVPNQRKRWSSVLWVSLTGCTEDNMVETTVRTESKRLFSVVRQLVEASNVMAERMDEAEASLAEATSRRKSSGKADAVLSEQVRALAERVASLDEQLQEQGNRNTELEARLQQLTERSDAADAAAVNQQERLESMCQEVTEDRDRSDQLQDKQRIQDEGLATAQEALGSFEARLDQLLPSFTEAQDRARTMFAVLETTYEEAKAACAAEDAGARTAMVLRLPAFVEVSRMAQEFASRSCEKAESDAALKLEEVVRDARARALQKLDKAHFDGFKTDINDELAQLKRQADHVEHVANTMKEEKADRASVATELAALDATKLDKTAFGDRVTQAEFAVANDRMDTFSDDLNNAWGRLGTLSSQLASTPATPGPAPGPTPGRDQGPSVGRDKQHRRSTLDPIRRPSSGSPAPAQQLNLEALKLRMSDLESTVGGQKQDLVHLHELKLDKAALRDIRGFLDKVTKRVDELGKGYTSLHRNVSDISAKTPYPGDGEGGGKGRVSVTPPATRAGRAASPAKCGPVGIVYIRPESVGDLPRVKQLRPSPPRTRTPGRSRYIPGACTFVRTSSGNFSAASIAQHC
ncbi:hypothetical protein DIPPA_22260 [Diplonema papillatum]|nr:hypothetical protein DIPPA_22260 [Diplonema papillatum]